MKKIGFFTAFTVLLFVFGFENVNAFPTNGEIKSFVKEERGSIDKDTVVISEAITRNLGKELRLMHERGYIEFMPKKQGDAMHPVFTEKLKKAPFLKRIYNSIGNNYAEMYVNSISEIEIANTASHEKDGIPFYSAEVILTLLPNEIGQVFGNNEGKKLYVYILFIGVGGGWEAFAITPSSERKEKSYWSEL